MSSQNVIPPKLLAGLYSAQIRRLLLDMFNPCFFALVTFATSKHRYSKESSFYGRILADTLPPNRADEKWRLNTPQRKERL